MFFDPATRELLRTRPNPLTYEQARTLRGARPAGHHPGPAPVTVQRRASNSGVIMVAGQKLALGRTTTQTVRHWKANATGNLRHHEHRSVRMAGEGTTMTVHATYGSSHTAHELAQLLANRLGLDFVEHDSYYRGSYLAADIPTGRIEIQPNAIPGDDGHHEPFDEDYPTTPTLLLVTAEEPDTTTACLNSIDGLHQLTREAR